MTTASTIGCIVAQLTSTGRSLVMCLTTSVFLVIPSAYCAVRQGWRLHCDQVAEAQQLEQAIEQMQALHLGGGARVPDVFDTYTVLFEPAEGRDDRLQTRDKNCHSTRLHRVQRWHGGGTCTGILIGET
ncbi:unnamed protein product [Prorocentrum cordatum]|uniref:Uncharacterized protein n=1 Tax=Prorocentrum cordatum TaxID=2364126 RepID=A0ABN9RB02_9DINO|nr:unnamed protein product [Polarella glacialis]